MIPRLLQNKLLKALKQSPAIAILGPRQVGKTTLAKQLAKSLKKQVLYLDLEKTSDMDKLKEAELFLEQQKDKCVIIDEIQRKADLFVLLRPLIDEKRVPARFIITGSSSPHLMKGATESLAGRIHYSYLDPINILEITTKEYKKHWFRGGFPKAFTARSNDACMDWLDDFIISYVERDLSHIYNINFSETVMRRLLTMLAHYHGQLWNANTFASSLDISAPTVNRYISFLEGAYLLTKLPPFYINITKRLVKSPKVYLRDSGLAHRLLNISSFEHLLSSPQLGASWEGYVIEQIKTNLPRRVDMYFYRTQDGAECDLVLARGHQVLACVEIKYSKSPVPSKGFFYAADDLKCPNRYIITAGEEDHIREGKVKVCTLTTFLSKHLHKM